MRHKFIWLWVQRILCPVENASLVSYAWVYMGADGFVGGSNLQVAQLVKGSSVPPLLYSLAVGLQKEHRMT